jgi:hypothetical protein
MNTTAIHPYSYVYPIGDFHCFSCEEYYLKQMSEKKKCLSNFSLYEPFFNRPSGSKSTGTGPPRISSSCLIWIGDYRSMGSDSTAYQDGMPTALMLSGGRGQPAAMFISGHLPYHVRVQSFARQRFRCPFSSDPPTVSGGSLARLWVHRRQHNVNSGWTMAVVGWRRY